MTNPPNDQQYPGENPNEPFGPPPPRQPEQGSPPPGWQQQLPPGGWQPSGQGWQQQPPPPGWQQQPPPGGWQPSGQGWQQLPYGYDPLAKSRVLAGVLGILFGSLGVHNFYTGYMQNGWIQLGLTLGSVVLTVITFGLFGPISTVVIPGVAIWGLVEGIMFLTQRTGRYSVDASGRPLRD